MKKIKRAKQLASRHKSLQQQEAKLEAQLIADWKAMKQFMRPVQLIKNLFKKLS